jgi:hypothetical protein
MKFLISLLLAFSTIALAGPAFKHSEMAVSLNYAGFGFDTAVETIPDGFPVNLTQAQGKGSFGKSSLAITVEFVPDAGVIGNCPEGFDLPFAVVPGNFWAVTITAADNSQVFGLFNTGWICLTADKLHYVGETSGFFIGGSGRFDGASGDWVSHYEGNNLDATIGFRSITGDMQGTLYLP